MFTIQKNHFFNKYQLKRKCWKPQKLKVEEWKKIDNSMNVVMQKLLKLVWKYLRNRKKLKKENFKDNDLTFFGKNVQNNYKK